MYSSFRHPSAVLKAALRRSTFFTSTVFFLDFFICLCFPEGSEHEQKKKHIYPTAAAPPERQNLSLRLKFEAKTRKVAVNGSARLLLQRSHLRGRRSLQSKAFPERNSVYFSMKTDSVETT